MSGRSWNKIFGILILSNGVLFLLHLVYNCINIPAAYSSLSVWDSFPTFYWSITHNPSARQLLRIFGVLLTILDLIMIILILVFGGLMKSHYHERKLNKFWNKILVSAIIQTFLLIFSAFYDNLFTNLYDKYLSEWDVWEDSIAFFVFKDIYPGIWAAIIGIFTIILAFNNLWAWLNFRSFSNEHLHRKISNSALLISLGGIPIILGVLSRYGVIALTVFWTLFDYDLIDTLPPVVGRIGKFNWMYLDFWTAMFIGVVSYVMFTVGYVITGLRFMITRKPKNITEEPVLEHLHETSKQSSRLSRTAKRAKKTQQDTTKACTNCNSKVPSKMNFCPFCGNSM